MQIDAILSRGGDVLLVDQDQALIGENEQIVDDVNAAHDLLAFGHDGIQILMNALYASESSHPRV